MAEEIGRLQVSRRNRREGPPLFGRREFDGEGLRRWSDTAYVRSRYRNGERHVKEEPSLIGDLTPPGRHSPDPNATGMKEPTPERFPDLEDNRGMEIRMGSSQWTTLFLFVLPNGRGKDSESPPPGTRAYQGQAGKDRGRGGVPRKRGRGEIERGVVCGSGTMA